ncbi:hypothetical protein HPB50_024195 [Hyalomma asiaticum]|uniref:Uncharacterized protein n=1 Tax=Hyalomma asiaticum TaxID=266040 RepID=A0ACB7RTJ1_HYAAI|nr:hypothetical protein HPB50_024195 [Hyalomma asiaticum]
MTENALLLVYLFATTPFCAKLSPSTFNSTVWQPPRHRARAVRPFYIIGHMVNSLKEVDDYLAQGSNALEADIEFAANGSVIGTHHRVPCDCFRNCGKRVPIAVYLGYIRDMTAWMEPEYRMNVLLSIGYVKDSDVTVGAMKFFKEKGPPDFFRNIGFDVGMNEPLIQIQHMYKRLGIASHRWQGDGLSNCLRFLKPLDRLLAVIKLRDREDGFVDKVYHWTIDLQFFIEESIRLGVDGIISNAPSNVHRVVTSDKFRSRLKVADIGDDPWLKIPRSRDEIEESKLYAMRRNIIRAPGAE